MWLSAENAKEIHRSVFNTGTHPDLNKYQGNICFDDSRKQMLYFQYSDFSRPEGKYFPINAASTLNQSIPVLNFLEYTPGGSVTHVWQKATLHPDITILSVNFSATRFEVNYESRNEELSKKICVSGKLLFPGTEISKIFFFQVSGIGLSEKQIIDFIIQNKE